MLKHSKIIVGTQQPSTLSAEFASPTIWGAIAGIALKLTETNSQMISSFDLRSAIEFSEERTKVYVAPVFSNVKTLEVEFKATLLQASKLINDRISSESEQIALLEQKGNPMDTLMSNNDDNSSNAFVQFENRVNQLEVNVSRVTAQTDQQVVRFFSLGFRGKDEANAWLVINESTHDYGLFVDVHMVLEHCPKIFDKKTAQQVVKDDSSYFDSIQTWSDWDEQDGGWHNKIKVNLTSFTTGHVKSIIEAFSSSSPTYNLSSLSLTESVSWVEGLIGFIDDYYKKLTKGKFCSRKCWHITPCCLAKHLIKEVASPRFRVIKMLIRMGQPEQISQTICWVTLCSLDVMTGITANNNYKNDPLVSFELVKFLAIRTGFEIIDKLQKDHVVEIQAKLTIAVKSAQAADASCKTASNRVDDLKKLCEALFKRLTKLEANP
eukprot:scaffold208_cov63-Attheya_sp.AAC.2